MSLDDDLKHEAKERAGWAGDYDGSRCINCRRSRVILCVNGHRVCEKCGWDQGKNAMSDMPTDMIG